MFAIVEISGEQFKIDQAMKSLRVPYMADASIGQEVTLGNAMVSQSEGGIKLGSGTLPTATVTGHSRGDKVIVFHKKRRKRYRKLNGHTQQYTELALNW
ncbi:MAG: 50S ribosomal protein L21 [Bacteroidota bacterium]|nr:50S ribosomal protein L21 [Bacteroidota bacterium]MDP4234787.1 50S ribosomal protein L21 [Bacteroidota bacterium]MDP4244099.1 50S ribosomal protein L21 [Bacteroidota bacterium]MDP4289431.1 50S ribosomal protein L21 [Bacteroidota bacterium]